MTKTITGAELKSNLETVLREIAEAREPYVIENDVEPAAILISTAEYGELRREWAWSVVDQIRAQNAGTPLEVIEEKVALAVEEVRQELYEESKLGTRAS